MSSCTTPKTSPKQNGETVILLHGLSRTSRAMEPVAAVLRNSGYKVINHDYPSRHASIHELAETSLHPLIESDVVRSASTVHFVTHSMGGIVLRDYLKNHRLKTLGRVVMLAPPNQGSEVVDRIGWWKLFGAINGVAGRELGTDPESTPNQLGAVDFPVGVVAGDRSINWINSTMIPGEDDGKVSIERTKVEGMSDHIVIPTSHPMMMSNNRAKRAVVEFLHNGKFEK